MSYVENAELSVEESSAIDTKTDQSCTPDTLESEANPEGPESCSGEGNDMDTQQRSSTDADSLDPYAYLERGVFTSENFKVELQNLPKYFGVKQLRKKLGLCRVNPVKFKVMEKAGYAFITFRNEEEREAAIKAVDGQTWKSRTIRAKKAKAAADPLVQKRKMEAEAAAEAGEGKRARQQKEAVDDKPVSERLNDSVTPYWRLGYEEQLQKKQADMRGYIEQLGKLIHRENKYLSPWIEQQRKENDGLCCTLNPIKRSPLTQFYRNKSEFTVGHSLEKTDKTVGFRLGSYKSGSVGVVEPTDCIHVPQAVKQALVHVQQYLQKVSDLPGLDPEAKQGNWTMVTMRNSFNNKDQAEKTTLNRGSCEITDAQNKDTRESGEEPVESKDESDNSITGSNDKNDVISKDSSENKDTGDTHTGDVGNSVDKGSTIAESSVDRMKEDLKNSTEKQPHSESDKSTDNSSNETALINEEKNAHISDKHSGDDNGVSDICSNQDTVENVKKIAGASGKICDVVEKYSDVTNSCDYVTESGQDYSGDIMAVLHLSMQGLDQEKVDLEKENIREFFKDVVGPSRPLASLHIEVMPINKKDGGVMEHLLGESHMTERLLGLTFRVSPAAFFQVNTPAAEVLYSTVAELADVGPNTVVLDVCCGTGTIGLSLAKRVKAVYGIEMCKEALEDAKHNAKINNIENAQFYCSKAEDVLPNLIGRFRNENVVAIVDPPRAGLHPEVVRVIRRSAFVKRLVYVSCQPTAAKPNLVDLTRAESKRMQGSEFRLMQAVPVDLFPQTLHTELVMLLTRD